MCSKVLCKTCKMPTWSGCGEHIEDALAGIPNEQRCPGHPKSKNGSGFFTKMFGKRNLQ